MFLEGLKTVAWQDHIVAPDVQGEDVGGAAQFREPGKLIAHDVAAGRHRHREVRHRDLPPGGLGDACREQRNVAGLHPARPHALGGGVPQGDVMDRVLGDVGD